jgi:hypothetical protein
MNSKRDRWEQRARWGVVLNPNKPVPVYHRIGSNRVVTGCGRKIGFLASWLQITHLRMIGKRCKGCWPR